MNIPRLTRYQFLQVFVYSKIYLRSQCVKQETEKRAHTLQYVLYYLSVHQICSRVMPNSLSFSFDLKYKISFMLFGTCVQVAILNSNRKKHQNEKDNRLTMDHEIGVVDTSMIASVAEDETEIFSLAVPLNGSRPCE